MTPLDGARLVGFAATTDARRSRRFYVDLLGLRLVEETEYALVLDSGGTQLRVQKVHAVGAAPYTALGWQVADVDVVVDRLAAAGVTVERYGIAGQDDRGVWTAPSGARVAWFRDPDGSLLSVQQP